MGSSVRVTHGAFQLRRDGGPARRSGCELRYDAIQSALHRDEDRVKLDGFPGIPGPIIDSGINETEIGVYAEEDWRPLKWVRFVLGGRIDRVDVNVVNESPTAVDKVSGYKGATQGSPKASMVVTPIEPLDLFVNYGRGFHTNDARTLIEGSATTLIATATGYEVGTTVRPANRALVLGGRVHARSLTSRARDRRRRAASTTPSGPTRRVGGEFTGRFDFNKNIYADATLTVTRARYTDAADIAAHTDLVELAPTRTFSAEIGARKQFGQFTLSGALNVRSMADRPATSDGSLTATGFTLFNGDASVRWKFVEAGLEVLNIANVDWREGQFEVASRLPKEGPNPPDGISFTPGIPRMFIGHGDASTGERGDEAMNLRHVRSASLVFGPRSRSVSGPALNRPRTTSQNPPPGPPSSCTLNALRSPDLPHRRIGGVHLRRRSSRPGRHEPRLQRRRPRRRRMTIFCCAPYGPVLQRLHRRLRAHMAGCVGDAFGFACCGGLTIAE